MPLFEFKCAACGRKEDKLQKYNDPAPMCTCPGFPGMQRQISACNHELKGTGWYKTDFKGK